MLGGTVLTSVKCKVLYKGSLIPLGLVAWALLTLRADGEPIGSGTLRPPFQELQPCKQVAGGARAFSHMDNPQWAAAHQAIVQQVQADKQRGVELVFYGDSITESWRGTGMGRKVPQWADIPKVFAKHYGNLRASVYAIGGDTVGNLLWRVRNGEGLQGLDPKAVWVLIGTNDLGLQPDLADAAAVAANISTGVSAVVNALLEQAPKTTVLLLELLPRGDPAAQPFPPYYAQPSVFTAAIDATNRCLQAYAALHERVDFVSCGHVFLQKLQGSGAEVLVKMPDGLHPNAEGMELLAQCLKPHLEEAGIDPSRQRLSSLVSRAAAFG
ncbi:hypothetical protein WJX73_004800 [Symbiochloris irregularis]|uniref:SGNH hydrolase-type esterase domain-containing protein n=1 Tax=Symbiochloris irregularis TaxID=706552 RepID=A0AAW1P5Y1_9CHLO